MDRPRVMQDQTGAHPHDARSRRRHGTYVRAHDSALRDCMRLLVLALPYEPSRLPTTGRVARTFAISSPNYCSGRDFPVQRTYGLPFSCTHRHAVLATYRSIKRYDSVSWEIASSYGALGASGDAISVWCSCLSCSGLLASVSGILSALCVQLTNAYLRKLWAW
jgi:hypothetical protein